MTVFVYDKTFEGLLTAVFDAYSRHSFPDLLLAEGEPFPLFYDEAVTICTDDAKVDRVWKGLQKRLSAMALSVITVTWLSELPEADMLLFRYIRKAIDAPRTIELNFGDPDVLEVQGMEKGDERAPACHPVPSFPKSGGRDFLCRCQASI